MRLIKIEQNARDKNRYTLIFENEIRMLSFTSILVEFGLFSGKEISEKEFSEIKNASEKAAAKARAARLIGLRPMSRAELIRKLTQKGESEENAAAAADWLEKLGVVDDARYAELLVKHYAGKGYGKAKIKEEFFRRGIDKELWDEALSRFTLPEGRLEAIVDSRLKGRAPDKKEIKRVGDALYRRGYSWEEIRSALSKYRDIYFEEMNQ